MFDIEAAIEARTQKSRLAAPLFTRAADTSVASPVVANPVGANLSRLHRRWLALYRGDHWSLERIAEFDNTTIARVWCGIVLALRHEPRNGRHRAESPSDRQAG